MSVPLQDISCLSNGFCRFIGILTDILGASLQRLAQPVQVGNGFVGRFG
jgi:hypothetical protein